MKNTITILALLALAASAPAAVTTVHRWDIGEGLDNGTAGSPVTGTLKDNVGTAHMNQSGSSSYSSDVGATGASGVNSTLSAATSSGGYYSNPAAFTASQNYGMELWVKAGAASQNANIFLPNGSQWGTPGLGGFGIAQSGANYAAIAPGVAWLGSSTVPVGTWTHLAAVLVGSNDARFYVNGKLNARGTVNPTESGTAAHFAVNAGGGTFFNGQVDYARVFTFGSGEFNNSDLLLDRYNVARSPLLVANPADYATQYTTGSGGVATRAIDGNPNGAWLSGSVTHTTDSDPSFWQVALGSLYVLDEIQLHNRTDCCGDRLSNFRVSVLDHGAEVWGQDFYTATGFAGAIEDITFDPVVGDMVRVQMLGDNRDGNMILSLAEVQIFGVVIPEPSTLALIGAGLALRARSRRGWRMENRG